MGYVRDVFVLSVLVNTMITGKNNQFFSIRWKAGLFFSSMLLIFLLVFHVIIYWNVQQKFAFFRSQLQEQYHHKLLGQLTTTRDQLQRLAELLISPNNVQEESSLKQKNILDRIHRYRSDLELNWDVSQVQLFDSTGKNLGGWGPPTPKVIKANITLTAENELAQSQINCEVSCKQYQLLPILADSNNNYVLVLGYNLTQSLLDFQAQTGADIAIISDQSSTEEFHQSDTLLWDRHLNVLTSFNSNITYLKYLSKHYRYEDIDHDKLILRDSGLPVEFQFIKLKQVNNVVLVIIDNISNQKQELASLTYRTIIWSLIGLIVIGGSLFLLLSAPLKRLSTVSRALPLLAEKKYLYVRNTLNRAAPNRFVDELNILEQSAIVLSEQLEDLENSVIQQTDSLNKRTEELIQERDFVSNLIDTAQLLIITLDKNYCVTSFNELATKITGYQADDVLGQSFEQFFHPSDWQEIQQSLDQLSYKGEKILHIESNILAADGQTHTISWIHSNFSIPTNNAVILSVGIDITEKKQNETELLWLATHDPLTELYNRKKLKSQFEHILKQAIYKNSSGFLLVLDLDHFKDINDSCGHNIGDQLLKNVARTLTEICRDKDVVARLGGDEFAIILPDIDLDKTIEICEQISLGLHALFFEFEQVRYSISSSIGIVPFPLDELNVDRLLSSADLAMYQAKSHGKDTWHLFTFDDTLRKQLQERMRWKQKIEDALTEDRFILYFQPIMQIRTQTVSHYEVLLRMQDEDGKIHSPGMFIEIAEQSGLIHRIDHYVLEKGIAKLAELEQQGKTITLSLNLSAHAMLDAELIPLLKRLLQHYNTSPNHLLFELTETAAVADINQARHLMREMRDLGCRFSIDDFGSGFASFRYLRELPVDVVKIDGMFITHITENNDDKLFVEALVSVAKGMGKKTVAEFVENAEILAVLAELDVDYAQGYYIGKPQPTLLDKPLTLN
ncbi:bifunctional diguanylate cyclase/phosphodiesterase [Methylophaga sulfidovorans]|uniref:PAS domain S-box-containing protein/diguanylate cyclase (GGDEF) domain-containing protein n=1 Tax=Methylophaga sulfidovorans TaxID=45496 RepID=A0A1I4BU22_9GAMM|nr:EAL domain-containing protein [Methylophaga sulfidovorans]SFK72274.1 PAS domain S-box-containing protein/diguanylate cyclase (GGDEF) domain-containing protein [Methylophaga sulfidovorans]